MSNYENREKIALATCLEHPNLTADEKLLKDYLRDFGFDAQPLVWNEPEQSLLNYTAVVIRSCWDYHKNSADFLQWIENLAADDVKVFNPPAILRWNLDKTYLRELAEAGIKIPTTTWFEKGGKGDLANILATNGWDKAVLKPTISATAWRTFVVTPENAGEMQAEFESLLLAGGAMIQKFVAEIQTSGEWSFVFFNKKFSHAVLKRARAGDFRVQNNFGGTVETNVKPSPDLVFRAQEIVEKIEVDLLYARVDGVEVEAEFCLMELELIEPVLFLENSEFAAQKFAAAIVNVLDANQERRGNGI